VKPFSATELLARVRAVLRRAQVSNEGGQNRYFEHENLRIDFARAEVWRGNQPVFLSATEYRLLLQFAHHVGKIMSAEELLTSVWGPEYKTDKEILWVSIARLRQKLEDEAHSPRHIVTRSGLGYLMPPIEEGKAGRCSPHDDVISVLIVDSNRRPACRSMALVTSNTGSQRLPVARTACCWPGATIHSHIHQHGLRKAQWRQSQSALRQAHRGDTLHRLQPGTHEQQRRASRCGRHRLRDVPPQLNDVRR
jgi:DNA-binding winged helix-turn-helix (wHTH) protein